MKRVQKRALYAFLEASGQPMGFSSALLVLVVNHVKLVSALDGSTSHSHSSPLRCLQDYLLFGVYLIPSSTTKYSQ